MGDLGLPIILFIIVMLVIQRRGRRADAPPQPRPPATYALLALIGALFLVECLISGGVTPMISVLLRMGATSKDPAHQGQWWRLLSASLLHGGVAHALANGFAIYNLGAFLEVLLGSRRLIVLYVLSVLGGGALSVLLGKAHLVSVGASGGLFGLVAATAVFGLWPRERISPALAQALRKGALFNLTINVIISLQPGIDYYAHLGGAVVGALLTLVGLILPPLPYSAPPPRDRWFTPAAVVLAALLLGSLVPALTLGRPWELASRQRTRHPLGTTGLTIELPAALRPVPSPASDTGEHIFGRFPDDPLVLGVTAKALSPEELAQKDLREEVRRSFTEAPLMEGAQAKGAVEEREVGGRPVWSQRYTLQNQATLQKAVLLHPRFIVVLEMALPPDLPARWQLDGAQLLGSVR